MLVWREGVGVGNVIEDVSIEGGCECPGKVLVWSMWEGVYGA